MALAAKVLDRVGSLKEGRGEVLGHGWGLGDSRRSVQRQKWNGENRGWCS